MTRFVPLPVFALVLSFSVRTLAAEPSKEECVAADDVAQSLRHADKLHEAREHLLLCASAGCPGLVRDDCAERLRDVDAAMPSLSFAVRDERGNEVTDARITMDGAPIAIPVGHRFQVDPGEHRFAFDDVSGAHAEATVVVNEGDRTTEVRAILSSPRAALVASRAAVPPPTNAPATPSLVAFGIGGAGLVLGTTFAIAGVLAKSQADSSCGAGGDQCPGDAASRNSTICTDTALAVTGFGVAAAGVALGALLLPHASPFRRQGGRSVVPILGLGYAGFGGRF